VIKKKKETAREVKIRMRARRLLVEERLIEKRLLINKITKEKVGSKNRAEAGAS
jgi:hypothetical protein